MGEHVNEIQVLTFCLLGVRMGVEASQLAGMIDPADAVGRELELLPILNGFPSIRKAETDFNPAKALLVKMGDCTTGVLIDQPDDIISIPIDSVRPLPLLLRMSMENGTIWGAALVDGEIILLLDIFKLVETLKYGLMEE